MSGIGASRGGPDKLRGQRIAVGLMLTLLIGFFVVAVSVHFAQSVRHGYGSGFSNREHVPKVVLERAGLPEGTSAEEVAKATNRTDGGGIWHDTWRILVWLAFCVSIVYFFMFMISRLGSF